MCVSETVFLDCWTFMVKQFSEELAISQAVSYTVTLDKKNICHVLNNILTDFSETALKNIKPKLIIFQSKQLSFIKT